MPPGTVDQALAEALGHTRNALAEGLLAGRSLLEAASLALAGRPSAQHPRSAVNGEAAGALARLAASLGELAGQVRSSSPDGGRALIEALLDALDSEIARWESRARQDPDARAVLRAFLGLRELLWELGMRPADGAASPDSPRPAARSKPRRTSGRAPRGSARRPDEAGTPETQADGTGSGGPPAPRRSRVQRVEVER